MPRCGSKWDVLFTIYGKWRTLRGNLNERLFERLGSMFKNSLVSTQKVYRGSPPSGDFGTWKKPRYTKLVLVGL